MRVLVPASLLLLNACQPSPLRRHDSGTKANDNDAQASDASCGDVQTDNNNCGRCGNVCSAIAPSTAQCVAGRCLTSLVSQDRVPSIVVAGSGVYWLNKIPADVWSGTGLWRASIEGGPPTILTTKCGYCYETGQPIATGLSCTPLNADARNLYCAISPTNDTAIYKMPLEGDSAPVFLTSGNALQITEIALDTSNIYWATCYKDSYIKRAPLDGSGQPADVAWNGGYCPSNLVLRDSSLYWLGIVDPRWGDDKTSLLKISITDDGAQPIPLVAWGKNWGRFVVGDAAIYWTDPDQSTVMALPLDGNSPSAIVTGLDSPRDLAVDAGHLYWASSEGGRIMRFTIADGALTEMATGQNRPHGIVVDASNVYWISTDGGQDTVFKLSPK
jgi:hypothetical protein